ncbi:MAG: hypothetical protein K2H09_06250 [Treponemataceae bacterium]|nr:hypothetical protein [Treponemataceae bacterium]
MKKHFFFLPLLLSVLPAPKALAEGWDECQQLAAFLTQNGCLVERHPILSNQENQFPFNISTEIVRMEKKAAAGAGDFFSEELSEERDTLILAFRVEDAAGNADFLTELIGGLRKAAAERTEACGITLLFTYGDEPRLPGGTTVTGTEAFVSQIAETDRLSAVCVRLTPRKSAVIPGSGGESSPAWLVKIIADAFYHAEIFYSIKGGIISSLYQLNVLQNDFRTALFLKNGIAAAGMEIAGLSEPAGAESADGGERRREAALKAAAAFSSIAAAYRPSETAAWDRHANQIAFGNRTLWIRERTTTTTFILVAFASLFILCEFSFIAPFKKKDASRDVVKLWYLIPLTALATALAFLAGQGIASLLSSILPADSYSEIALKLFAGFVLISFAFILIIRIQGALQESAYSYLLSVAGILNIFLFSAVDISLFYLFAAEYIIIFCSRPAKRTPTLAVLFIVMAVPFMPYAVQIIKYAEPSSLNALVQSSFLLNLLVAFGFLPFEIMWLRILARLNRMWDEADSRTKQFRRQNLLAIGGAVAIFAVLLVVMLRLIPEEYKAGRSQPESAAVELSGEAGIELSATDSRFFGETARTITIRMERQPEVCIVEVRGADANSILYSDDEHQTDKAAFTDTFRFPVWPPKDITLRCIADDSVDSSITVSAYYPGGTEPDAAEETFLLFQKSISIPGTRAKTGAAEEL